MRIYVPGDELVVFDGTPPRQHVGFDAVRKDYQDFFAVFSGSEIPNFIALLLCNLSGMLARPFRATP